MALNNIQGVIDRIQNLNVTEDMKTSLKQGVVVDYDLTKVTDEANFIRLIYLTAYKGPAGRDTVMAELGNKSRSAIAPGLTVSQLARICKQSHDALVVKFNLAPIYPGRWEPKSKK